MDNMRESPALLFPPQPLIFTCVQYPLALQTLLVFSLSFKYDNLFLAFLQTFPFAPFHSHTAGWLCPAFLYPKIALQDFFPVSSHSTFTLISLAFPMLLCSFSVHPENLPFYSYELLELDQSSVFSSEG